MTDDDFTNAVATLHSFIPRTAMVANYRLDGMVALLAYLGDPQERVRVVHIAGTSGKTSTAYFTYALLTEAGYRVGLTVSPYISSITERVQFGGRPVTPGEFAALVREFVPLVRESGVTPTYFELLVAMAYWDFARESVDYAVVETGLGGRLDGTNVVHRRDKVCEITDIGLDHTEILGDTLTQIAYEKAGIIHPGNHVLLQDQDELVVEFVQSHAGHVGATVDVVREDVPTGIPLPPFQRRNWRLAVATYAHLADRDALPALTPAQFDAAAATQPPGRMELRRAGSKTVILDGAHNPQKLQALVEALEVDGRTPIPTLANFVAAPPEKIKAAVAELARLTTHLVVPEFQLLQDLRKQSLAANATAVQARAAGIATVEAVPDVRAAFDRLLAVPEPAVLVTGSLYLVGLVRALTEPNDPNTA